MEHLDLLFRELPSGIRVVTQGSHENRSQSRAQPQGRVPWGTGGKITSYQAGPRFQVGPQVPTGIQSGRRKPGVARSLDAMLVSAPQAVFRSDAPDDSSWALLSRGRESLLGTVALVLVRGR